MSIINIIFIIIGGFLSFLGFLIFKFKMLDFVAGYDEGKEIDKEGLAKWIGSNLMLMGFVVIVSSVICDMAEINSVFLFIPIVLMFVIRIVIGNKRYEKK